MTAKPAIAGVVATVVGFASSVPIVLTGLAGAGATDAQAASGLFVLLVTLGVLSLWLALRTRLPIALAWSTPGAALLISIGDVEGGYPAVLGAIALAGVLIALAGLWRPLARALAAIPAPLAAALLAGVLLPICLAPARSMVEEPVLTTPVVLVWAALFVVRRAWAVPGALLAGAIAVGLDAGGGIEAALPVVEATAPVFEPATLLGVGIPLFVVTMASQNVAGAAVLRTFGYDPPMRPVLVSTGAVTALSAPLGAHGVNLAAITAALAAGPEAGERLDRRWIAVASGGVTYLALGLAAGLATSAVGAAPPILVQAVAGIALLGALTAALAAATADAEYRDAAIVVLVVSASGITALGVSAPFWGLVAGLALQALRRRRETQVPVTSVSRETEVPVTSVSRGRP